MTLPSYGFCIHHGLHGAYVCPDCAAAERDTLNVLEARIADLETAIGFLRRRITELEHGRISGQDATNAQATAIETLEAHIAEIGRQSVHIDVRLVIE